MAYKEIKYDDGCYYEGEVDEGGNRSGQGRLVWADGSIYEGEFLNNSRNGYGRLVLRNRWIYEGNWRFEKCSGYGKLTLTDGTVYEGDWENNRLVLEGDCRSGYGKAVYGQGLWFICEGDWRTCTICTMVKITYDDGSVFNGDLWNPAGRSGKGKQTYANGDVYVGEWQKDKRHGKGEITYADGSSYNGFWQNDNRHGRGKMTYSNGDVYEGSWNLDSLCGTGKMTYANGLIYEGSWKNDKRNGTGKLTFSTGMLCISEWKDDVPYGEGKLVYTSGETIYGEWNKNSRFIIDEDREKNGGKVLLLTGDVYEGEWKDGDACGVGKMTYANGDMYEGEFCNGHRQGNGKLILKNGHIYEGEFGSDGEFKGGRHFISYPNENVYEGDTNNQNKPHGKGKLICVAGGYTCEGEFVNGEFYEGKRTYLDGSVIESKFKGYNPVGFGKYIFPNGRTFEGDWSYPYLVLEGTSGYGFGKTVSFNGEIYEGEFRDSKYNGRGCLRFPNGNSYEGKFSSGRFGGLGKLTLYDGTVYEGEWRTGYLFLSDKIDEGYGRVILYTGDIYEGDVRSGRPYGNGKRICLDGTVEEGEFDLEIKFGKKIHPDGTVEEGEFFSGMLLKNKPHKIYTIDAEEIEQCRKKTDKYTGETNAKGEPHGEGMMRYADGTLYKGEWAYGQWYGEGTFVEAEKTYRGVWIGTKKSNIVTLTENGEAFCGMFRKGSFVKI